MEVDIMVSVTLAVPAEVKKKMDSFPEMNWSGFVRKQIIEKVETLTWKEEMLKKFAEEKEFIDWSVQLQKKARNGRGKQLKKMGLV